MSASQGRYSQRAVPAGHHPGRARRRPRPTPAPTPPRAVARALRGAGARDRRLARGAQHAREDAPQLLHPGCWPRQIDRRRGLCGDRRRAMTSTRCSPPTARGASPPSRWVRAATLLARVAALRAQQAPGRRRPARRRRGARRPARAQRRARAGRAADRAPARPRRGRATNCCGAASAGLAGGGGRELSSQSTNQRGLDRGGRRGAHDPRATWAQPIPRGHARQADRDRRRAALGQPARADGAPARDRRAAAEGAGASCCWRARCCCSLAARRPRGARGRCARARWRCCGRRSPR